MTILCLASYDKGYDFLRQCKRLGCHVVLVTSLSIKEKAKFPVDGYDEIFYMPDNNHHWDRTQLVNAVSHLARTRYIDRIVALDDFDVEVAAMLREHLRVPGMGETTVRHFRDKLAMRMVAGEAGVLVPRFVHVLNDRKLNQFLAHVPAPWVLKPRSMAGAIGIKKVNSADEFWRLSEALGDTRSHYLLEQFIPGDIFHVDSIIYEREVRFAIASGYGRPPMEVSHTGGIFTTRILDRGAEPAVSLVVENARVMAALRMVRGVSHTEFIRAHDDGRVYFLETSARVGGAHIADLVEAASGLNLWAEWAKVEVSGGKSPYDVAPTRHDIAGLLVCLSRVAEPDLSTFAEPEVVWRMNKEHHVGLIVRSSNGQRVQQLLDAYSQRAQYEFLATLPPKEKPNS